MPSELTALLLNSQSPDQPIRVAAEQQLKAAEDSNIAGYLTALSDELKCDEKPDVARQLAGILLKNAISGTDELVDKAKRARWMQLPTEVADAIQEAVLLALKSASEAARSAACQVVSKVGRLDLPRGRWPQLLPFLLEMVAAAASHPEFRRSAVMALGYLCEDTAILQQQSTSEEDVLSDAKRNQILTSIIQGALDADPSVRVAALKALYHALQFAAQNMQNEEERNYIFQTVGRNLEYADLRVQHAAWEGVLVLATEFYEYLGPYMKTLGALSLKPISAAAARAVDSSDPQARQLEAVALAALEFWNSICDEEAMIAEGESARVSLNIMKQAESFLLPVLFEAMTRQDSESVEMDEWTLAMAAGCCVGLCAQVLKDDLLPKALQFVNSNFVNPDWKHREAAVFCYGSIMEGPSSEKLEPLVLASFESLCNALNDSSVAVRDTTAWAIGRIAAFHTPCIVGLLGTPQRSGLIVMLLEKLRDDPRVAAYICYALHEIARNIRHCAATYEDPLRPEETLRTPLDPFFPQIVNVLLEITQRPDANEANLRSSAFEALASVIDGVGSLIASNLEQTMLQLVEKLSDWLEKSFAFSPGEEISHLQGLICGCLNNLFVRLGPAVAVGTERLAPMLLRVVRTAAITPAAAPATQAQISAAQTQYRAGAGDSRGGAEEDALLAVASLARAAGNAFESFMPNLAEVLHAGLANHKNLQFCRCCVGVVSEMAAHLENRALLPYVKDIIEELLKILRSQEVPIFAKPGVMFALGDIALALEKDFEPFLTAFLQLLYHAASTRVHDGPQTEEWVEYLRELRDAVLAAYSGIIHGLRLGGRLDLFKPHVTSVIGFVQVIVEDQYSSDTNLSKAVELTGDLVTAYKRELTVHLMKMPFYEMMSARAMTSQDAVTKERIDFLRNAVSRCNQVAPHQQQ